MSIGPYELLCLLVILAATTYSYLKYRFNYWVRHRVPQIKPTILLGNLGGLLRMHKSPADYFLDLYNQPEAVGQPLVGIHIFHKPAIYVRHPELVKRILIKDFSKFSNRYSSSDTKCDPIGSLNIFFLKNPAWKEIRSKLSPFFTSIRMKNMFYLIKEVGDELNAHLLSQPIENMEQQSFCIEMKEICALYTTDVIATVAYGVKANSFKYPNGDFRRNGRKVFDFSTKRAIEMSTVFFMPHLIPLLGFKVVPPESTNFLRSTINYIMKERELSGNTRNDLIDILIEFKKWSKIHRKEHELAFENDVLIAQAALFFTAGFETSSATMSFVLYELAKAPNLQHRLREEICVVLEKNDWKITTQMIDSLEYMQMIISEVLRLYPPLPFLDRECTVERGSSYSLEPFSNYHIPPGMPIYVAAYGIHMDPEYYPNPTVFDPERFSPHNKKLIDPSTYMPFGLGPHGCIGERFALLQTKIGLVSFLRNHFVATCEKTQDHMKLDPKAIIVQAKDGIYLNVVRDPLRLSAMDSYKKRS